MCHRGFEVRGPWQKVQPLLEPRFVTNGAKVGPKAVSVRCKCFIFVSELLKSAFVSVLELYEVVLLEVCGKSLWG